MAPPSSAFQHIRVRYDPQQLHHTARCNRHPHCQTATRVHTGIIQQYIRYDTQNHTCTHPKQHTTSVYTSTSYISFFFSRVKLQVCDWAAYLAFTTITAALLFCARVHQLVLLGMIACVMICAFVQQSLGAAFDIRGRFSQSRASYFVSCELATQQFTAVHSSSYLVVRKFYHPTRLRRYRHLLAARQRRSNSNRVPQEGRFQACYAHHSPEVSKQQYLMIG